MAPNGRTLAVLVALAAAALLAASPMAAAKPGAFVATERTFYLSGDASPTDPGALALSLEAPAAQGQQSFVLPGVSVLGVVDQQAMQAWSSDLRWDKDLEATADAVARLFFAANVQAMATFEVRLVNLAPDGTASLVDSTQRQFVTALSPTAVEFPLRTTGVVVEQGHVVRIEVFAQTVAAAVVLQYGGATPSALEGLTTRWLDTDGDGVADSDETALGRNPLDADDAGGDLSDADGDGLDGPAEARLGTDPAAGDSDGDGWADGLEARAGSDPLDGTQVPADADADGLPDDYETTYFGDLGYGGADDPDGDSCPNLREAVYGTDPTQDDSDGDGVSDCDELDDGTDPANAQSVIAGPGGGPPEPVATAAFFAIGSSLCLIPLIRRPRP